MPKVTFIIDGEETVIEFEHGTVPYSNHGKPESFLDLAKHFHVPLEHACGGSCAVHDLPRDHQRGRTEPQRDAG
jgi:2Fe-2S ferredoxin